MELTFNINPIILCDPAPNPNTQQYDNNNKL